MQLCKFRLSAVFPKDSFKARLCISLAIKPHPKNSGQVSVLVSSPCLQHSAVCDSREGRKRQPLATEQKNIYIVYIKNIYIILRKFKSIWISLRLCSSESLGFLSRRKPWQFCWHLKQQILLPGQCVVFISLLQFYFTCIWFPFRPPQSRHPLRIIFLTMGVWVFFGLELFYMLKHCLPHDKAQKWIFKIPFGALVYLYGAPCVLRETQDTAKYWSLTR